MNKNDIYDLLKQKNIWHEIKEHQAVFTVEEAEKNDITYPGCGAKNLFVRDDKNRAYYLLTVKSDKEVDLKKFRDTYQTRRLSFVSEKYLFDILELIPGAVTPFGLLNDDELKVKLFLDKDFLDDRGIIGVHPNDNTATVWLKADDLIHIIKEHGNEINIVEF